MTQNIDKCAGSEGQISGMIQTIKRPAQNSDDTADRSQHDGFEGELQRMSFLRAPIAFRTPISRVRSVTLTSMIFITPTPPTISPHWRWRTSR